MKFLPAFLLFLALSGCQSLPPKNTLATITRPQSLIRTELYFAAVPLPEWEGFLEKEVTPRFPDGLSWFDVHGQWRGRSGKISRLPSRVLEILHDRSLEKDRAMDAIRTAFKKQFRQQSVLRVSLPAATSF